MAGYDRNDQNMPDRVRALERKVDALLKGAPMRNTSITEGGIRVGGDGYIRSTNWDGTSLNDPGTQGWALGGPEGIAIINTLFLRAGIVGNDALANPVRQAFASNAQTGFGLATSFQDLAPATIVVPPGFDSAVVFSFASVLAQNPAGGVADWLWIESGIAGETSGGMPAQASPGAWVTHGIMGVSLKSGLRREGDTITVAARAFAQQRAWASATANRAYTRAVALLFRN